jgi:uncharacterized membrane protein
MRRSVYELTPKEFKEHVKNSLACEGYTNKNEMLVRAVEIIEEKSRLIEVLINDKNSNNCKK